MKKLISLLLSLLLLAGALPAAIAEESVATTLVISFSRVGITEFENDVDARSSASLYLGDDGQLVGNSQIVAGYAAELLLADQFQLITEQAYPSSYDATIDVAMDEQTANARPALKELPDLSGYDTIILVYPNWWGTIPMALYTFVESVDLTGRTVAPICTHGGSAMGRSERDLQAACPGASWLDGLAIHGSDVADSRETVREWLTGLHLL